MPEARKPARKQERAVDGRVRVVIESVSGTTEGEAVLREGIRPDTVLMIGQFDHWKTPYAKDLKLPSLNSASPHRSNPTRTTGRQVLKCRQWLKKIKELNRLMRLSRLPLTQRRKRPSKRRWNAT